MAGAGRLKAGGRNLTAQISRRNQIFGHRNLIIRNKHHFEPVIDPRVIVDNLRHIVNQLNHKLGKSDILIAAIGSPEFVKADMVKEGAVVIDVGTTRIPSTETKSGWRLCGDVAFDQVAPKCSYITPVPGGVGPMTIVSLMQNTLLAAQGKIY
ncbi:MAG: hypothetical protein II683_08735 [Muribaculaceae bacterium]|nr:hypothetical protein [Muribaculaceae bacterium]